MPGKRQHAAPEVMDWADERFHRLMAILAADAAGYSRLMSITGNYDRGVECARLGLSDAPNVPQLHMHLGMNLVGLGDIAQAKEAFATAQQLSLASVERALTGPVYRKPEHVHRTTTFMRIAAGLEEPSTADALR